MIAVPTSAACRRPAAPRRWTYVALFLVAVVVVMLAGCAGSEQPKRRIRAADQVVVEKSKRRLTLIRNGEVLREYRVALGERPWGHKVRQGDERTPEGNYFLDWRNPNSRFYKSIHISYPNKWDIRFARLRGYDPGGMIMIHGQPNHIRSAKFKERYLTRDWTNGCIAVQNHEMDEIWRLVRYGTPIKILP
ncbi:L,D-transpeptidase family protein [Candidatus Thiosymbion oneisti]|uniref:L,D-transpeptidase family protein n=1 Tax=Candidatus Thiosymbion oneisti TaxID=589554 RepID=UPI001FB18B3B|nr:L,D-transpeptidase family protein [Candidatus Thiosymbion oneisti]